MNIKAAVEHIAKVREAIGEQLIPGLAHSALGEAGPDPNAADHAAVTVAIEQVLATYVLAWYIAEVASEVRTEGRSVTLMNGDYPLEVRTRES